MNALYSVNIPTDDGEKNISVYASDVLSFDEPVDILTTSAFRHSYYPTPNTLFHALQRADISVEELAEAPEFDFRMQCDIWLSKSLTENRIGRIGCIEMRYQAYDADGYMELRVDEQAMLRSLKAYFQMLDLAATCGVKMDTVAVPVLGSGSQEVAVDLILIPLLNECVQFLKRNAAVKRVLFIERDQAKAFRVAQTLLRSYSIRNERMLSAVKPQVQRKAKAFISHSSIDKNVADNLCAKLEAKGVQVWYSPRNVRGDYASAIVNGIMGAEHFIVILSKNSMASEHVLNEIDLAFKRLPSGVKFHPLRIDEQQFAPAFEYYLSRQHWMDAYLPPLEDRLNEFVDSVLETI